jgi:hypothetical protein
MIHLTSNQKEILNRILPLSIKFLLKRAQLSIQAIGAVDRWEKAGRPNPPPHIIKQQIIRDYCQRYQTTILVETGTFVGNMIEAQKGNFKTVYSIELDHDLHQAARKRFSSEPHIHPLQGDSGESLKALMPQIHATALFWLDGHYSGGFTARGNKDCPIYGELEAIFSSPHPHVILIDDARCFDGTHDYPTLDELKGFIVRVRPNYQVSVETDIIRVVPTI